MAPAAINRRKAKVFRWLGAIVPSAMGLVLSLVVQREAMARPGARAVVVIMGGGSPHAFTTPWDACDGGRPPFVQGLIDAGLPTFTAPGYGNLYASTFGKTGCPLPPPFEVQWNTTGYPTQAGQAVLGFLGYLHATYGYTTFDLVGYSYGGLVARATLAALKRQPAAHTMAPGFSYARSAVEAGVTIPTLTTLNAPHLGSPTYDIVADPTRFTAPVLKAWGPQVVDAGKRLAAFEQEGGAGALQVLTTSAHATPGPRNWDAQQLGALDGVSLTLIAGNYCGRSCGDRDTPPSSTPAGPLRTDGTVPVYSQLMLPCPKGCPTPPGIVLIPPGLLPANVARRVFPTLHSTYDAGRLGLPEILSVTKDPAAIAFLIDTIRTAWLTSGEPLLENPERAGLKELKKKQSLP
jgi:hypothetical protein